jgi:SAM-dependent methyltransferase
VPDPLAQVARLEAMAALRGLRPAPLADARVLELGCGTGANLLPLALACPGATIIGCDLAESATSFAGDVADELGLDNIEFRHADLASIDASWGEFDYIVCHDVFSWVAPRLRLKILEIQATRLAAQGVGYISYDALPGWHFHEAALGMMRYQARPQSGFRETVDRARAVLAMAAEALDQESGVYASVLRDEHWLMSSIPDAHLYHLTSSAQHRAFYFHEFVQEVRAANLEWIGDAGGDRAEVTWPEATRTFLAQQPAEDRQQYLEFLNNRSFARALLCRHDAQRRGVFDPQVVEALWVGLTSGAVLEPTEAGGLCLSLNGRKAFRSNDIAIQRALRRMESARPQLLPVSELFDAASSAPPGFLMQALATGALEAVLSPFNLTSRIEDRPMVSPLVRLEARAGRVVTNQKTEPVQLNGPMQFVLQRLDGKHDRTALTGAIEAQMHAGELTADPDCPFARLRIPAAEIAAECLRQARRHALLVEH